MPESCLAFQYKQGVGLLNTISVKILNAGNFKVAEKVVGKPSIFNKSKVYTGFNPAYAKYITQEARYLAVFDYDTDVQLDIHNIMTTQGRVTPDEDLLQRKIMSGAMWNAQQRIRDERIKQPWWKSITAQFLILMITTIVIFYWFLHGSPINATVDVRVIPTQAGNYTYVQTINNGSINSGIVGAINGAAHGAYNAITAGANSIGAATTHGQSVVP